MPSLWVKWRLSSFDFAEITINDVLGEASRSVDEKPCEARSELHGGKTYIVDTKKGLYVLCRRCCKVIGLPVHG
jgi:hypothetical protein